MIKKISILVIGALFSVKGQAQLTPATYFTFDGIAATKYKKPEIGSDEVRNYSYYNPFFSKTFFSGKYQIGIFGEGVLEPDVYSLNPGVMFIAQGKNVYHELGVGPGFEFPRKGKNEEGQKVTYINAYYYIEGMPDVALAKGKWYGCVSFGYAPNDWGQWHMAFAMYYVSKHWAFGLHDQTYAVSGPRVQYTFALNDNARSTLWFAAGDKSAALGLNVTSLFSKK